jgi:hypothetical protein
MATETPNSPNDQQIRRAEIGVERRWGGINQF